MDADFVYCRIIVCRGARDDYVLTLDKRRRAGDGDDWGDGVGNGKRVRSNRALVPCLVCGGNFDGVIADGEVLQFCRKIIPCQGDGATIDICSVEFERYAFEVWFGD